MNKNKSKLQGQLAANANNRPLLQNAVVGHAVIHDDDLGHETPGWSVADPSKIMNIGIHVVKPDW